jgi:hypothetical protein
MNRALLVSFVVFCCVWSVSGQPNAAAPATYAPAAKNVDQSINQWEQRTNIKVYSDARSQLSDDVRELDVAQLYVPKERYEDALSWTKDVLVKTYLYAVSARNRAQLFISKADIESYRIKEYVRERLKILGDPFGNIEFISMPAGATIQRDNQDIGVTQMGLVVSPGPHDYAILSDRNKLECRLKIEVERGTSRRMACPPRTR